MRRQLKGRLAAKMKVAACTSRVKQLVEEAQESGSHNSPVKDTKRLPRALAAQGAPLGEGHRVGPNGRMDLG